MYSWENFGRLWLLSIVYCLGHLALAVDQTRSGLAIGLSLIAIGSGGIKPCVSANLGDQFSSGNSHLLSKAFYWFYFAINFGAGISTLSTPWLLQHVGPHVAFGMARDIDANCHLGVLDGSMEICAYSSKRNSLSFENCWSTENLQAIWRLTPLFLFTAFFWSLYDQTGSAWVLQAKHMDRYWMGIEWLPSQIQVVNPFLIMVLIPSFFIWSYIP